MGMPENSLVITCGYYQKPEQQHLKLLKSIVTIKDKLPVNYLFVFPMTYPGNRDYISTVEEFLIKNKLKYKLFKTWLSNNEVALLRKASEIMISVMKNDQFSGALLEYIYTGNLIITGSWLPYKKLDELRIFRYKVDTVDEVGNTLIKSISEINTKRKLFKINSKIIQKFVTDENPIEKWINKYQELLAKQYD